MDLGAAPFNIIQFGIISDLYLNIDVLVFYIIIFTWPLQLCTSGHSRDSMSYLKIPAGSANFSRSALDPYAEFLN